MKDKFGIWTSIICLIHCLIFPILATTLPVFVKIDKEVEFFLLITAVFIGTLSFIDNVAKHKYYLSLILFFAGFFVIFASVFSEYHHLNIPGLIILIIAHYLNYKKIKESDGCHPHGCQH